MLRLLNDVYNTLIDGLDRLTTYDKAIMAEDVHNEIFNRDYLYEYYSEAAEVLNEADIWDCLAVVETYERTNYGVVSRLSDSCKVANLLSYIIGEALINQLFGDLLDSFSANDETLSPDALREMQAQAEKWLKENPDGMAELWDSLPRD